MSSQTDIIIRTYYTTAPLLAYSAVTLYFLMAVADGNVVGSVNIIAAVILVLFGWPVFKFFEKLGDPLPHYRLKSFGATIISGILIYFLARPSTWATFENAGNGFIRVVHHPYSFHFLVPGILLFALLVRMFIATLITTVYDD
jgi:hypothetical protein